ncbi:MAG TPA: hypothetical protein VID74_04755, partial [Gemmatimonadales bacterium]
MSPSSCSRFVASIFALLILALVTNVAPAQVPSAAQARQALETRPGLATQLRERIAASGLTP